MTYKIFSDKLPDTVSENLSQMTVKNVLSMNTGHEGCVMYHMKSAQDSVRAFLEQDPNTYPELILLIIPAHLPDCIRYREKKYEIF